MEVGGHVWIAQVQDRGNGGRGTEPEGRMRVSDTASPSWAAVRRMTAESLPACMHARVQQNANARTRIEPVQSSSASARAAHPARRSARPHLWPHLALQLAVGLKDQPPGSHLALSFGSVHARAVECRLARALVCTRNRATQAHTCRSSLLAQAASVQHGSVAPGIKRLGGQMPCAPPPTRRHPPSREHGACWQQLRPGHNQPATLASAPRARLRHPLTIGGAAGAQETSQASAAGAGPRSPVPLHWEQLVHVLPRHAWLTPHGAA